jgi:putative methylase
MQKRIVRKLELEMVLSRVEPHPEPKTDIEQYTISVDAAARMLFVAAYADNNILDRSVLDLGCGTGRLALGAAFLGAKEVLGVDIDKTAVRVAVENSKKIGLEDDVDWLVADVSTLRGDFDVVLQNPPYGVQKPGADRKFLEKALEVGRTVYSLHKHQHADKNLYRKVKSCSAGMVTVSPSPFLERLIEKQGRKIKAVYAMMMSIPYMFSFHMKRKHEFIVDLYVINGSQLQPAEQTVKA